MCGLFKAGGFGYEIGARDALIGCAGECLPEPVIRSMISELQKWADNEKDGYEKRHHLQLIESLARQINDAELFEKNHMKIPEGDSSKVYDRDLLLREIYRRQGNIEKLTDLLYQKFRSNHSTDTLQELLDVIGNDKRDEIIADEVVLILENTTLRELDVEFLITIGKIDEAEKYLISWAEQLNGDHYESLLSLAETMEATNRNLSASLIYRSLLLSILERGYTKAYPYGIHYLEKLDKLASVVIDWKNFNHHHAFKDQIVLVHGRKYSFWSKYEVKK